MGKLNKKGVVHLLSGGKPLPKYGENVHHSFASEET